MTDHDCKSLLDALEPIKALAETLLVEHSQWHPEALIWCAGDHRPSIVNGTFWAGPVVKMGQLRKLLDAIYLTQARIAAREDYNIADVLDTLEEE